MIEKNFDSTGGTKQFRYSVTPEKCEIRNVRFSAVTDDGGDWLSLNTDNHYLYLTVAENTTPQGRSGRTYAYFSGKEPCVDDAHTIKVVQEGKDCGELVNTVYEINDQTVIINGCDTIHRINVFYNLISTYENGCVVVTERQNALVGIDLSDYNIGENCYNKPMVYEIEITENNIIEGPTDIEPSSSSFTIHISQEVCPSISGTCCGTPEDSGITYAPIYPSGEEAFTIGGCDAVVSIPVKKTTHIKYARGSSCKDVTTEEDITMSIDVGINCDEGGKIVERQLPDDTVVRFVQDICEDTSICGEPEPSEYTTQYLTFESVDDNVSIYLGVNENYTSSAKTISASTDNGATWTAYTATSEWTLIATLDTGEKLLVKGENSDYRHNIFNSDDATQPYKVYGNIMSLVSGDSFVSATTLGAYAFQELFNGAAGLTDASNLILPVKNLANNCYYGMFFNCTSLTAAPELPARTLESGCYGYMFNGCTSLNYIKCLATDISATDCTKDWVSGVAASGRFVKPSSMSSWTRGNGGIPTGWTVQNA